jgi:hypothetical protein
LPGGAAIVAELVAAAIIGLAATAANADTVVTIEPAAVQGPDTRPCAFVKPVGANFWYVLPMTVTFATDFQIVLAAATSGKPLQLTVTGRTVTACPDLTSGLPYPEVMAPLLFAQ